MNPLRRLATAALVALLFTSLAVPNAHAEVLSIRNTMDFPRTLSDLVAYDAAKASTFILQPGDVGDDIKIPGKGQRVFTVPDGTASFWVSETNAKGEGGTKVFRGELGGVPKKLPMLSDLNGDPTVFLSIDFSLYNFAPPDDGTVISFINGINPGFDGWFAGTGFDFDTGTITGAHSGDAVVFTSFEVSIVPEPSTYAMALAAVACGGFSMWRRRKRA